MSSSSKILSEIFRLKLEIATRYPELMKYLDEEPITIPNQAKPKVDDASLNEYLHTLKNLIEKYGGA
ncbi:hypothetical protein [Changchengzhania lutea]|uniref:hypothetical protein n=1 Tax=Changchengzhania lutea TaxID=2049305 RepID=UPI00115F31B5|nr:hypothetical protein [Changchengzhania lutea]